MQWRNCLSGNNYKHTQFLWWSLFHIKLGLCFHLKVCSPEQKMYLHLMLTYEVLLLQSMFLNTFFWWYHPKRHNVKGGQVEARWSGTLRQQTPSSRASYGILSRATVADLWSSCHMFAVKRPLSDASDCLDCSLAAYVDSSLTAGSWQKLFSPKE